MFLQAQLLGHPPPKVVWLKNGEEIKNGESGNDGNTYFFQIQSVRQEDAGRYSIVAKNGLGKQVHHVVVKVGDKDGLENGIVPSQSLADLKFTVRSDLPPSAVPAIPSVSFAAKPETTRSKFHSKPAENEKPKNAEIARKELSVTPSITEPSCDTNSETEADQNVAEGTDFYQQIIMKPIEHFLTLEIILKST